MEIVGPDKFVPSNIDILGERHPEDISIDWYIIAKAGPEQAISIDLNRERLGRCYDSFREIHAVSRSSGIVATSFVDLVVGIYRNSDQYWF